MKDPYQKAFEQISEAILKLNNRIVELGKRTLTVNEFEEYVNAIEEKEKNACKEARYDGDLKSFFSKGEDNGNSKSKKDH